MEIIRPTVHHLDLNHREEGATVFIVGAGPQLATLSREMLAELSRRPTIGVNLTQHMVAPSYFISAYLDHHIMARLRAPDAVFIHMRPVLAPPPLDFLLPVRRQRFDPGMILHAELDAEDPLIITRRNVALGATHLALILGARNIVYIGVEQDNASHFYDELEPVKALIRADLEVLKDYRDLPRDHGYTTSEIVTAALETPPHELRAQPFGEDHTDVFAEYFRQIRGHGGAIYSASASGVVNRAGAEPVTIEQSLDL